MSDSLKKLGQRVRQVRTRKGFSQEKIAELSGISTKYMSDLERGHANVSVRILERIAANLGIRAMDLMDNDHEAQRDLLVKEIVDFLETASDEKVKIVYRIMKGIL